VEGGGSGQVPCLRIEEKPRPVAHESSTSSNTCVRACRRCAHQTDRHPAG
jgi:hypothetical protein